MKTKKEYSLVYIYIEYIKKQGTFNFGIDDLERLGLTGILVFYMLDWETLTEEDKEELWKELKQLAEENDYIKEFEKINQRD